MGRAEQITKELKLHDRKLYCKRGIEGKLCIFRESHRIESYDLNGHILTSVRPAPHLIMALTHNWQVHGSPADWGLIPIISRLKEMDLWNRDLAAEYEAKHEKNIQTKKRDFSSKTEDFLKDSRRAFAKDWDGINTAGIKKQDNRKLKEKR